MSISKVSFGSAFLLTEKSIKNKLQEKHQKEFVNIPIRRPDWDTSLVLTGDDAIIYNSACGMKQKSIANLYYQDAKQNRDFQNISYYG